MCGSYNQVHMDYRHLPGPICMILGFSNPHPVIGIRVCECLVEVVNKCTGINLLLCLEGEEEMGTSNVQAIHPRFI